MGTFLKKNNPISFDRELFKLHDGGTIGLDWVDSIPTAKDEKKPIVAVMPGLSSNSDEIYVLNLCIKGREKGYKVVVINYRGSSKVPLSSPMLYCAASVDDLRQPLEYIHEKYASKTDLYLIGNSMGANIAANYLGEEGSKSFLKAACCVEPPMKMWECGDNIEKRLFGFYNYVLGKNLKVKFETMIPVISEPFLEKHGIDLRESLRKSRHLIDIDSHITSKTFGYGDVKTYYDRASCIHRIPGIKTPTFFLMAKDDPIIGEKAIDSSVCENNPYILLGVTNKGGHLGYFESITTSK
jgi:abhydrolase domain-containing protein 1/3